MKNLAILLLLAVGCGGEREADETRTSEINSIGSWYTMTGLVTAVGSSPVFAKGAGQTWTAFAWSNADHQFYVTQQFTDGSFSPNWTRISTGESLGGQPSVTVMKNYNPYRFLVVARDIDDHLRVQVQDRTGTVIYNSWHTILPSAFFHSSPAVAFQLILGASSVVIVARGPDDTLYWTRNNVAAGYNPTNWTAPLQISPTVYDFAPAITATCGNFTSSQYIAAARRPSDGAYEYYSFDGTSWSGATTLLYGLFQRGPALACSPNPGGNAEISAWGIGLPSGNGLWYSTQISTGIGGFGGAGIAADTGTYPTVASDGSSLLRIGIRTGNSIKTTYALSP